MVGVVGNIDNLQSSIDFYLNIISKDEVADSRFMRDRFFSIFDKEDSLRDENFLVFQEVISDNYVIDDSVEPVLAGDECLFDYSKSYFSKNTVGEGISSKELEEEIIPEDCSNIDLEDEIVIEEEIEEKVVSDEPSKGTDSEDIFTNYSDDSQGEEYEDMFSSWGSSDDEDLGVSVEVKGFEGDEMSKDDFAEWGNDSEDDLDFLEDYFTEDTSHVAEQKNIIVNVNNSYEDENVVNVPNDLRDFVKMYPNCELSFVYKYFSKKEVEKQLRLGRVFKRKNKLLI